MWHVHTGPMSPRQSVGCSGLSTTMTEAINRKPQRVATGAAAPTPTDHSTAYPVGGASEKNMAIASPISQSARPNSTRTERSTKNTEDTLKTSTAASASLFRAWRFRAPSTAHPRDPESDSFLSVAFAAKKKEAGGGAHATTYAVALVYSSRCLSTGSCVTYCVIITYQIKLD